MAEVPDLQVREIGGTRLCSPLFDLCFKYSKGAVAAMPTFFAEFGVWYQWVRGVGRGWGLDKIFGVLGIGLMSVSRVAKRPDQKARLFLVTFASVYAGVCDLVGGWGAGILV